MRALVFACCLLLCAFSAEAGSKRKKKGGGGSTNKHAVVGHLYINGELVEVRWSDGDSFRFLSGPYFGKGTRLEGYNTLEGYGPVHRWGAWKAGELFAIAESSSKLAASQEWNCTTDGKLDGYRRVLVNCPDAAKELLRQGHGMAYAIEGHKASAELLEVQREAQAKKVGIWAKGVPNGVITSLHSVGEENGRSDEASYDRIVDTRTGAALRRTHRATYESCQEVCHETDGTQSCMVYVPFSKRYRDKPKCLEGSGSDAAD